MEFVDVPVVIEKDEDDKRPPRDKLLGILDQIEAHVERLRKETQLLEEKKDSIFTALDTIKNSDLITELQSTDRDDIDRYIERLTSRCTTIEVFVRTERDKEQEEALFQVNRYIDGLVVSFKTDPITTRVKCKSFMAACTSQPEIASDKAFESALLGCALDDQKKIKKRLYGLFTYIDQSTVIAQEINDD
ncbi:hypothetical protein O3M35_011579 [Rhynocoris fuscipes]|uniref:BAG family molecular chaperone regulator 2 n=1 Tax=Rhynocoris fuscipes TaxID=488301 RepID=A0AAW1CX62_9HEMI